MKKNIKNSVRTAVFVVVAVSILILFERKETSGTSSSEDYWQTFAGISLERKYFEEAGAHYRIPVFTPELQGLEGKEITLSGYFLPYAMLDSVIIISRFPNASCFFCGQAGIESVAMVELEKIDHSYEMDQILTVRGTLLLNATNLDKLAFVLANASIEEF